jgi:hypothetical protein
MFSEFDLVLVDESQFLTAEQVDVLRDVATRQGVPVVCYGLKCDSDNHLFEGARRLIEVSDDLIEARATCRSRGCPRKATCTMRIDSAGIIILNNEIIEIGGDVKYRGVCHWCYTSAIDAAELSSELAASKNVCCEKGDAIFIKHVRAHTDSQIELFTRRPRAHSNTLKRVPLGGGARASHQFKSNQKYIKR